MIVQELANSAPMALNYMATKLDVNPLDSRDPEQPVVDFCYCKYECDYEELAFGDTTPSATERTNDKSSFLYRTILAADTVTIRLLKNGTTVATISDSSLGDFFPKGSITAQPNYVWFEANWGLILAAHGAGVYTVEADTVIIGAAATVASHKFRIYPYNFRIADGTVKIVTEQNGNILASPFNYTGINYRQSVRIKGKFHDKQAVLEVDKYLTTSRKQTQIQDQLQNTFTLEAYLLPSFIGNLVIEDNLLANTIKVYDYSIWNYEVYNGIEVAPEEVESGQFFSQSKRGTFIMKFSERTQDRLKRNFT